MGQRLLAMLFLTAASADLAADDAARSAVKDALQAGNWADALRLAELRLDSGDGDPQDLADAVTCLQRLGRPEAFDTLVASAVARYGANAGMLLEAARSYRRTESYGHLVAGEFRRGRARGAAETVGVGEADRVRQIRLAFRALSGASTDAVRIEALKTLAEALVFGRTGELAWRLQKLTDPDGPLPEADAEWWAVGRSDPPVAPDGKGPLLYDVPKTWDLAASDGERWRWCLAEQKRIDPGRKPAVDLAYAEFLLDQFGVQTLAQDGWFTPPSDEDPSRETSALAVETLEDSETIARLATGVHRFTLPEGHRFVELFHKHNACSQLFSIYLSRNQRSKALEVGTAWLETATDERTRRRLGERLAQITRPWVRFESTATQPAGAGVELLVDHRNAATVEFVARKVDVERLLADTRELISDPPKEYRYLDVERLGRRLVLKAHHKYVTDEVARWSVEVETPADHRDGETPITAPLPKAGAYFVTATPVGPDGRRGEVSNIVAWSADTVIVRKPTRDGVLYQVLDAVNGQPIEGAMVDAFGHRRMVRNQQRRGVETTRIAERTDEDGLVLLSLDRLENDGGYQWLATATTKDGRLAYVGFDHLWRSDPDLSPPNVARTFVVSDRPVYRPADRVEFKAWIGKPNYTDAATPDARPATSEYAHQEFQIDLYDARGDKVDSQRLTSDAYGGLVGSYEIPEDGSLGVYRIDLVGFGGGTFRVEEYRKPEFEVFVEAPDEPTKLGDSFDATIRADYYAGTPVRGGNVEYKVVRTARTTRWRPIGPWDWLYGRGYSWLGQDATWRSDWRRWGCWAPLPPWWGDASGPAEVVAEGEAELDADGALRLTIDTDTALERHPDSDHEYTITAEVTDAGRRTTSGSGSVLAARKPLEVTVWLDRGHYEVGQTARAHVSVRRPDGEPVAGEGELRLLRIGPPIAPAPSPDGDADALAEPDESLVQSWRLASDADGSAEVRIKTSEPGRYRLAYRSDAAEEAGEGGLIFSIRGSGFDDGEFRYSALEVIPDKPEYAPGDTARLLINTDRRDAAVTLFLRPLSGVYARPQVLQLDGKSTVVEIPIGRGDLPNFFVEAHTVADGEVHTVTKQIVVPPESRMLNIDAEPSATTYLPGEEGSLRIRLTDAEGDPVVGQATIAVYDRSVEAIAGGPSGGDIREVFWSWKRNHSPTTTHNLARTEYAVTAPGVPTMQNLGFLGNVVPRRGRELAFGGGFERSMMDQALAAPMAATAESDVASRVLAFGSAPEDAEEAGQALPVAVRENFADTALWIGRVETDADGFATIEMPLPESLTSWKIRAWAVGEGLRVGQGEAEVVTRKDLMVRLRATRFLVDGDEAVVSALVQNESPRDLSVTVRIEADGDSLSLPTGEPRTIEVLAGEEALVDWRIAARAEGDATLRAIATVDGEPNLSDGMQAELPVLVHGAERVESFSAVIQRDERLATFELVVPEERRPEATRLEVRYSPTLVGSMLDALPYLIEYPHGCTEQTLNRFLPAAIVRKTIEDLGVDLAGLKPDEVGKGPRRNSPVFDREELDKVTRAGVTRLMEMQLSDGGWGWFSGWGERSTPHTTVVVVRGLGLAAEAGVAVPDDVLERGREWLVRYRAEQLDRLANVNKEGQALDKKRPSKRSPDNLDALVELSLVEAGDRETDEMLRRLFDDRLNLAPYCQAALGLALHLRSEGPGGGLDYAEMRDRVIRNLKQFVQSDDENQTAWLDLPGESWWYWYGSEYEAHAYFLKLLAATEPDGDLAPRLVKYLLNNRRNATRWNSTRDTALVIEAMSDYVRSSGETAGDGAVEIWLDGKLRDTRSFDAATALRFDGRFVLQGDEIPTGRHTLELRKQSAGRLYAGASLANFTLEDDIRAAGLEVRVSRRVNKLVPIVAEGEDVDGRGGVLSPKVERYRRVSLPNLGEVASGDLIEVELTVVSKNNYEYLILEDPKPAGFEPVEARSGYNGNALGAYVEFRDERVVFYARTLARGERTLTYRMRAETPGRFAALPTQIRAMYAPELRGNSDEIKLVVEDD